MAVTQIGTLVQFTTGSNQVADLNSNLSLITTQFNALVTGSNALISGLTIPSPILSGTTAIGGTQGYANATALSVNYGTTLKTVGAIGTAQLVAGTIQAVSNGDIIDGLEIVTTHDVNSKTNVAARALYIQTSSVGTPVTLTGLYVAAVTGATTNYAIYTNGGIVRFGDLVKIAASVAGSSGLNMASGTAPTSPNDGDFWYDGTNLKFRVGGTTKTITIT